MDDRTTALIDRLHREPVPVRWADVEARRDRAGGDEVHPELRASRPSSRRWALAAAMCLVAVVVAAAALAVRDEPASRVATVPSTVAEPGPEPVVLPDSGFARGGAATVWTGSTYLVWGGQLMNDGSETNTGWRFTPATGATEPLAPSPLPPSWSHAGVWTGEELIVCCGNPPASEETAAAPRAAAYDPEADTWRPIAEPPAKALSTVIGAAWTGIEVLVVVQLGDPASYDYGDEGLGLFAYDPAADIWEERAKPTGGDRFGESVWTGQQLVLWFQRAPGWDGGVSYDPATDTWSDLPLLPSDAPVHDGSATFAAGQLVVFGLDGRDETRTVGHRLRPGDTEWRPMAPAPIPPIEWYEGTPGSQTILADGTGERVVVYPTHGFERGGGGATSPPPNLLAYDPEQDTWTELGPLVTGAPFAPDLTAAGDLILLPDLDDTIGLDLSS
jgi:hypothetical protein